ncbi:MAG: ABC transporter permease [Candidatus Thermoplasmatota archaeon]|nr:ABC transporter permease [Candidatus Thermoplasmatota archaeon]
MHPILRLVVRDLKGMDKSLLIIQLLLPLLYLFVAGFTYSALIPPFEVDGRIVPYTQFLAAGVILLSILTGSLIAGVFLWVDRRLRMYEQILMGPFTKSQYAFSKILSSMLAGLAGGIIVALAAVPVLFGVTPTAFGVLLGIFAMVFGSLFFGGLGLTLSTILKTEASFNAMLNLLILMFMFLSSAFYPASAAPPAIQAVLYLNPLTHAADVLRFGLFGLASPYVLWEGVALVAEGAAVFFLAVLAFRRIKV